MSLYKKNKINDKPCPNGSFCIGFKLKLCFMNHNPLDKRVLKIDCTRLDKSKIPCPLSNTCPYHNKLETNESGYPITCMFFH